jgi:sugar/nucleoside kinase (ribokinase family)
LLQAASDIFLGWDRFTGPDGVVRDFYIRQLRDWKGSWPPEAMDSQAMQFIGGAAAWTLARGHARSGDRIAIASYLGKSDTFDRAIETFAEAYADQNQRDYEALQAAAAGGRIQVEAGL